MATTASQPSGRRGETFNERSKGKDVRTSNVIAAKVCSMEYFEKNRVIFPKQRNRLCLKF